MENGVLEMYIHENRIQLVGEMYQYVHKLVDISIQNNWKIIIWGFGRGGRLLRHLIQDVDTRTQVAYIIDEYMRIPYDFQPAVYHSSLLEYIDASEYMVLSCVKNMEENQEKLIGFTEGENLFDVEKEIGNSYVEFLERRNNRVNFSSTLKKNMEKDYGKDCIDHIPFAYSCVDNVFDEILHLDKEIKFFDYGCGKGAALLMAYMSGIRKIGGVEIVNSIYQQAAINMQELHIECDLRNQDATECNIDKYNVFFFYNPFQGKLFEKVIRNIQESYKYNKRNIYLIYGNPFCHQIVIKDGFFKLYKQIRTDLYDPLLNIYKIDNEKGIINEL